MIVMVNSKEYITFRTLMGILDDYFDGYYSEEMIESQVIVFPSSWFCILSCTIDCIEMGINYKYLSVDYQVDQLVLEELVREKFPKLGLSLVINFFSYSFSFCK